MAHRLAWEFYRGPIPDGMWVLHRCDNPSCVNPEHLWLGTPKDNALDRQVKGRQNRRPGDLRRVVPRGVGMGRAAKLTELQVLEIRALAAVLPQAEIARRYGVTPQHIGYIISRKNWTHI